MSVDKEYCCSSYLALRYVYDEDKEFAEGLDHRNAVLRPQADRTACEGAADMDEAFREVFEGQKGRRLGIMLSGGMDSACLASYMLGSDAYTFRFLGGSFQGDETGRAESFARAYRLKLHYVDISWQDVLNNIDECMESRQTPVHSIEPQILKAARQAKEDGVEVLVFGEGADNNFGGMSKSLQKDWTFDEFVKWYMYIDPEAVLVNPVDVRYVFEPYRTEGGIDNVRFMKEVYAAESETSYQSVLGLAGMEWLYPYTSVRMARPLDLTRIRRGETKYMIRELFSMKYPDLPIPDKNPMPRPVDRYFEEWEGPRRPEFRRGLDISGFTGNQKWQLWCLERFLDKYC